MTRKEAKAILENDIVDGHVEGNARFMDAFWMAVDALSQEPQCTEQPCLGTLCRYYKEPCRVKNELNVELNELKPCTDAVSRKAVIEILENYGCTNREGLIFKDIRALPSVTHKSGKWIRWREEVQRGTHYTENIPHCKCSECDTEYDIFASRFINYCPNYGCRMVEPQESEDKERIKAIPSAEPNMTWVTGADGAKIAFKDVPVWKVTKICEILGEPQESEDKQ